MNRDMGEIYKIVWAEKAKVEKTDGFQGCSNLGNGCNFTGFYLARYSPEGLCTNCELEKFPERFKGCCFCGKVIHHGAACWGCKEGVSEWILNLFYNKNKDSKTTTSIFAVPSPDETNDWKLWQIITIGIHCLGDTLKYFSCVRIFELAGLRDEWPGFYVGNNENKFYKPNPYDLKEGIDISDINWDNKVSVIKRELEKKGFHIDKEIQYQEI